MFKVFSLLPVFILLTSLSAQQDTLPPGPVTDVSYTLIGDTLIISWSNPEDADFVGVMIRYVNEWTYERDPNYGTFLADTTSETVSHEVETGVPYVFSFFAYDTASNFSEPYFLPFYIPITDHDSLRILFIHHSCGSNWLATGNGNLRDSLEAQGYSVHDATYGDVIGENTDVCDWYPKFRDQLDLVFTFDYHPNHYYQNGEENDIIMFKSCFPNSNIISDGEPPGDPEDCTRTLWNYYAAYNACAGIFKDHEDKLFVPVTAPPLIASHTTPENAERARTFNNWLKSEWVEAYRDSYGLYNTAVFDFFDLLTRHGYSNYEEYPSGGGYDDHPNSTGNRIATREFIPFINWAVDQWQLHSLPYVPGDANGDGVVNINDLLFLASYIFGGGPQPDPYLSGDENGDGIVDASDISYLANYLFGTGPPPSGS